MEFESESNEYLIEPDDIEKIRIIAKQYRVSSSAVEGPIERRKCHFFLLANHRTRFSLSREFFSACTKAI